MIYIARRTSILGSLFLLTFLGVWILPADSQVGSTCITRWQDGKPAAVSLTYDDGYLKQFTVAIPMMNRLHLPATFFIITGQFPGSRYKGEFIGRPIVDIISETATVPTNKHNFFERASAVPYLGFLGTLDYHVKAGSLYEAGKIEEAYKLIDEVYRKVRAGDFKRGTHHGSNAKGITWDDIRAFASQGHEFASHTVTHHMTPVLDEPNLLYELEKSKEDILRELGPRYTFSAECSYGIEDPRVMKYALKIYPALRNRMPEPYLAELDRSSKKSPGEFDKEYVQWQRGATTKTPLPMMESWVDTALSHKNVWLVLVFHGVDGNGYEALSHELLEKYFNYIKGREARLWIATFGDVARYMRERQNATVQTINSTGKIILRLNHTLDTAMYNIPLTLKTIVPENWKHVEVRQGSTVSHKEPVKEGSDTYVLYRAYPNSAEIKLSRTE